MEVSSKTLEEIEEFISKNPNSVVTYEEEKHHGFEVENPCTGIIFNGDLYLFKETHPKKWDPIEPLPYFWVETESHYPQGNKERFWKISKLELETSENKKAKTVLKCLNQNRNLMEGHNLYITENDYSSGITIGRRRTIYPVRT